MVVESRTKYGSGRGSVVAVARVRGDSGNEEEEEDGREKEMLLDTQRAGGSVGEM